MTENPSFHEADPSGLATLERFAHATHFNKWMFDTIRPYCKGHVLEVGSGIGNLSRLFLENGFSLTASDLREEYCSILQHSLGNLPGLQGVELMDLAAADFGSHYRHLTGKHDTVIALNVVEHIKEDSLAIQNCMQLLKPGGRVVILVPAYQFLYNSFDVELGHYVRYNKDSLSRLMEGQGLEIIHKQYFNAVGILGWMFNGNFLHKKIIPRKQLQLFDTFLPFIKLADSVTFHRIGLSVIAVGCKNS